MWEVTCLIESSQCLGELLTGHDVDIAVLAVYFIDDIPRNAHVLDCFL